MPRNTMPGLLRVVSNAEISQRRKKKTPTRMPHNFHESYKCIDHSITHRMAIGKAYTTRDSFQLGPTMATNGK